MYITPSPNIWTTTAKGTSMYYKVVIDRLGSGTWDPLLQCLHLDKRLLEQQNTKKL